MMGGLPNPNELKYDIYRERNIITALIAQEHERWNTFHIVSGFVPMRIDEMTFDSERIKFTTKDLNLKKHMCLTTYAGLDKMSKYQLDKALAYNSDKKIEDYDVYKYDLMFLYKANNILNDLGYKIIKKNK